MSLSFIRARLSTPFNDQVLDMLTKKFAPLYPFDHDVTVQISLESNLLFRSSIRYDMEEPQIPGFWLYQEYNMSLIDSVRNLLNDYKTKHECKHEHFIRARSKDGIEFGDGTGECACCDVWTAPNHFEEIKTTQVIDMSIQQRHKYATRNNWDDTFIQGNDHGLVIGYSKHSYMTAFFEAFPTIGEHSTFIRGEGNSIFEAEQEAWEKYQRRLACDGHEWSRNVNGSERDDGYAICTKCNLTATALEPLTQCHKCGSPAKKTTKQGHICDKDYASLSFDELLEHMIHIQMYMIEVRHKDKDMALATQEAEFTAHVYTTFITVFRKAYIKAGFTYSEMRQRERRYCGKYFNLLKQSAYDTKVFHSLTKIPNINHPDVIANYKIMENGINDIITQLLSKPETINFSPLINDVIVKAGIK